MICSPPACSGSKRPATRSTLHCHDEAVCEVSEGVGSSEDFMRLMIALPDWAAGLPLAAKAWTRVSYAKPPAAPEPSVPVPAPLNSGIEELAAKINGFRASLVEPATATIVGSSRQHQAGNALERVALSELIGEPLSDGKIGCPFHADDTPSLHVYADHFHCFGCGAHGDHVDWLMMVEGMNRDAALRVLERWDGPTARPRQIHNDNASRTLAAALRLWDAAQPIAGTPAMHYLDEIRGINTNALPTDNAVLRFHPSCPFGAGIRMPCLIALYRDVATDAPAGIHRIALTSEVFAGGKVERRSLGQWPTPRAIKLWPAADRLFLGEGIETVLAAATRLQHRGTPMRPAWAAGSSGNISKFPIIAGIKQLMLLVDHDASGEESTHACRRAWRDAGREVLRLRPRRVGADFNDVVLENHHAVP